MSIQFGTDGWRAVISDTFTYANLRMVSQAIADAVISPGWLSLSKLESVENPNRVVVGYDTRFLSDRYAKEVWIGVMVWGVEQSAAYTKQFRLHQELGR